MKPAKKKSVAPADNDVLSIDEALAEWNRRMAEVPLLSEERRLRIALARKPGMKHSAFPRPQPSDALAVHPKQRDEAIKFCKDRGVPTDYTPGGRPVITSVAHQKRHAKIRGHRPKRGY